MCVHMCIDGRLCCSSSSSSKCCYSCGSHLDSILRLVVIFTHVWWRVVRLAFCFVFVTNNWIPMLPLSFLRQLPWKNPSRSFWLLVITCYDVESMSWWSLSSCGGWLHSYPHQGRRWLMVVVVERPVPKYSPIVDKSLASFPNQLPQ